MNRHLALLALLFFAGACQTTRDPRTTDAAGAQPAAPTVVLNAVEQDQEPAASAQAVQPTPAALPSEYTNASRGLLEAMEAALGELQVVTSKQ